MVAHFVSGPIDRSSIFNFWEWKEILTSFLPLSGAPGVSSIKKKKKSEASQIRELVSAIDSGYLGR